MSESEKEQKPQLETSGLSIAGLVCGIASVVLCLVPGVHFILGTLAIIFGAITFKKKRFGVAALTLGIVGFVFAILYVLVIVGMAASSTAAAVSTGTL